MVSNVIRKIDNLTKDLLRSKSKWDSFLAGPIWSYYSKETYKIFAYTSYLAEVLVVRPNKYFLQYIIQLCQGILPFAHHNRKGLSEYVSFTRLNITILDRISCDWCSIVNGILHYIDDTINFALKNKDINILSWSFKSHDYNLFLKGLRFVPKSIVRDLYNKNEALVRVQDYRSKIDKLFPKAPAKIKKLFIKSISELLILQHIVASIESRWCPFKHLRELALKKVNHRQFNWINYDELMRASILIGKHGKIDCHNCANLINDGLSLENDIENTSPFAEYFKHLLTLFEANKLM
jgi:hypothetical protein